MKVMKVRIKILYIVFLSLFIVFTASCKRSTLEEPNPVGPSTYSLLLKVLASPNIIYAGSRTHPKTTITATLKKYNGVPLSGKTLYFEIGDAAGNKVNIGYFEGNDLVKTKITDKNGVARVVYYGPTAKEITTNADVYIWVSLTSKGEEFIVENAPITIIRDILEANLSVTVKPNVLFAGEKRETATATALIQKYDGTPVPNQKLYFEVGDVNGDKSNIGFFKGHNSIKQARTNSAGKASVTYLGPLASEITANTTIYIWATYSQEKSPLQITQSDFVQANSPLLLIRDVTDIDLEIIADPNVLNATDKRPKAEIRATAKKVDGLPLERRKIYFSILSGPGKFSNHKKKTFKKTNKNGIASITYIGPNKSEIEYDTTVTIRAHLETVSPDYIHKEVDIRILKNFEK